MNTTARIKIKGKNFEIIVDLDKAMNFKKGISTSVDFLEIDKIFSDSKKGNIASEKDIFECFETDEINEIAERIVKQGEVLVTQDYRDEERERKIKQIVDFLSTHGIDSTTNRPHTPERIKNALEQAHINIKNVPIENQIQDIINEISSIIPIKLETKKVKITIPAVHTGKTYGLVNTYKIKEDWLSDGSLNVWIEIPAGLIMNFYDKLNSLTHGSALTEEIKD